MEVKWSFASLNANFIHEHYDTREEAINAAREIYKDGFYIGKLEKRS